MSGVLSRIRRGRDDLATPSALMVLGLLLATTTIIAAGAGSVSVPATDIITYLLSLIGLADASALDWQHAAVLGSIRFPRIVLGIAVGVTLSVAGASLQAVFRNPLADPGLVGVSGGAAFAAAAAIVVGSSVAQGPYVLPIAAFLGGLVVTGLIYRLSRIEGRPQTSTMLLAGIAINALCGAGIGLFTYLSDDVQLRQLTFWTMGSLGGSAWDRIIPALVVMTGASLVLIRLAPRFNVFVLGEREAEHLGLDVPRFLKLVVIMVSLGVGAAVAVSGLIGFIGLVVPHLVRLLLGPDHRRLLPASAVLGAVLITAADTVARTAVSPAEMPIGLLCSAVGGPFFLWLLSRRQKGIGL